MATSLPQRRSRLGRGWVLSTDLSEWLPGERGVATRLGIYPGDKVTQARSFYRQVDPDALGELPDGWVAEPNLHFAHFNKHLLWTRAREPVGAYVDFRRDHQGWIRKVPEDEFGALCALLCERGMMEEGDREEFDRLFVTTSRSSVNVCPGIRMCYRWPAADAARLDREGELVAEIERRVREAVRVWGVGQAWSSAIAPTSSTAA